MSRVQTLSPSTVTRARLVREAAALQTQSKVDRQRMEEPAAASDEMSERKLRTALPADNTCMTDLAVCSAFGMKPSRTTKGAPRRGLSDLDAAGSSVATRSDPKTEAEPASPPPARTHVVVPGDTLSAIAAQNDVPLDEVIAANPQIQNPDVIEIGDVIHLPAGAAAAGATTTAPSPSEADRELSGGLPTSAAAANEHHVTQFIDPQYNPSGPLGSANCGPASLAMTLDTLGKLPPGLSPEQRIDYARSLMNPATPPTSYVTDSNGTSVPQLDTDSAYSNVGQLETAASSLGVPTTNGSGWDQLDATLAAGKPVVANGNAYQAWRDQFPHTGGKRYGSGDVQHFNTILGKTPDGKYVVSDPMYTGGPVEMTREQLGVFFGPLYGGNPSFLALG